MNVIVLFGGKSPEHDVSVSSALNVINGLDKAKYSVYALYIAGDGQWKLPMAVTCQLEGTRQLLAPCSAPAAISEVLQVIEPRLSESIAFPVLHGPYGEDGTIQGLFEMLGLPYVGNGVLASSAAMDKAVMKVLYEAEFQHKKHKIILMIDIGDLREGIWIDDEKSIHKAVQSALRCRGLELAGIGTNLTCYWGVIPMVENYTALCELAELLRARYGIELPIVSGGDSSCIDLLMSGTLPQGITNLRVDRAVLMGRELVHGDRIDGWYDDAFTMLAEIVEIQGKPSLPWESSQ